ncbi:hypothetical protein VP01_639g5 [Puccinia sorghi]|uniref:Uncharacterized protein n=1 Tax=Puccinia sorghi TaxID=27349 RepID=A0A0L6UGR4_9BASI|nr:hypothetical protein VP01_639g5 [Puccinia sorghi]
MSGSFLDGACLWCDKEVRVSGSSFSNLRTHCDGSRQGGRNSAGFPKRQLAIQSGAKIPPSRSSDQAQSGKKWQKTL